MKKQAKRILSLLLAAVMLLSMAACTPEDPSNGTAGSTGDPTGTTAPVIQDEYFLPKEEGCNQLTIYWDYDDDVATAGFWIWPNEGAGKSYGTYECSYGVKCMVNIPKDVTRVGFIAIYGDVTFGGDSWPGGTKDYDGDRFVDMNGDTTVYLKSGDGGVYFSEDGGKTLYMKQEINTVGMTSFTTIKYNLSVSTRITDLSQIKVKADGQEVTVLSLSTLNNKVNHGEITLAEELDLSKNYTLEIENYGSATIVPSAIFDSEEFISKYTYDGNDLGATINADGSTTFKLWAPTASQVVLNLFTAGNGVDAHANLEMTKADKGVWELTVPETGHGTYYTYTVTTCMGAQEAVDPYAKACGVNGDRGMVVDLDATDPANWANDRVVTLEKYTDATIWEIHVRDFSNTIAASQYQGKYLAFTEHGLINAGGVPVGVDYLRELGVSHIHLLPVYDYASVDEANPSFNWGYDPENYNCLEGSYSTDPYHGEVRINEFKQMIQSLHADGLGVIMDVVYNHTFDANSNLNKVVPYYYYRYDAKGKNTSASGCGNDTASERYMYRKYMVDSVSYLASEYNLDGFRFDLMGLHDVETMQAIEKAVHAINPNAIIYGEAWDMAGSTTDAVMMTQANASKVTATEGAAGAVAVFSDTIRDGLKGSVWDAVPHGYINGNYSSNTAAVKFGLSGTTAKGGAWKVKDANVINYMSCHDNNALWDILAMSCEGSTVEDRMARNRLGIGIIMTAQGVPFWQAGEEMLRSKPNGDGTFNHNSYNASDAVNNIKWDALTTDSNEYAMMQYYKGLLQMRKAYGIFRADSDDVTVTFANLTGGGIAATYTGTDGSQAIVVINPTDAADTYTLTGEWNLIVDANRSGSDVLSVETGEVSVAACSIMVFVK